MAHRFIVTMTNGGETISRAVNTNTAESAREIADAIWGDRGFRVTNVVMEIT